VLGAEPRVVGWALAGVLPVPVGTRDEARAAWAALPGDVALVLLTADAAEALAAELADPTSDRLTAVMPP
jgi:hypothetical protein